MIMNTQIQLTDRTNKFVVAIQKLNEAEDAVLDAMTETYGDEQGTSMTEKLDFSRINDEVLRCMRVVILENLRDNPSSL